MAQVSFTSFDTTKIKFSFHQNMVHTTTTTKTITKYKKVGKAIDETHGHKN
jgi:hypothetical protein